MPLRTALTASMPASTACSPPSGHGMADRARSANAARNPGVARAHALPPRRTTVGRAGAIV